LARISAENDSSHLIVGVVKGYSLIFIDNQQQPESRVTTELKLKSGELQTIAIYPFHSSIALHNSLFCTVRNNTYYTKHYANMANLSENCQQSGLCSTTWDLASSEQIQSFLSTVQSMHSTVQSKKLLKIVNNHFGELDKSLQRMILSTAFEEFDVRAPVSETAYQSCHHGRIKRTFLETIRIAPLLSSVEINAIVNTYSGITSNEKAWLEQFQSIEVGFHLFFHIFDIAKLFWGVTRVVTK